MFYISAAIYAIGMIFFTIFAQGEVQPWVRPYMFDEEMPVVQTQPVEGDKALLANKPEKETDQTKVWFCLRTLEQLDYIYSYSSLALKPSRENGVVTLATKTGRLSSCLVHHFLADANPEQI